MAIPYPEGECFFERKALKAPGGSYDPENLGHFYSNMMVEYIYNEESYHGEKAANFEGGGFQHQRSAYNIVRTMAYDTYFGAWEQLPFSYGPTPQTVTRRAQHSLCIHAPAFVARDKGDAAQSWLMIMPLPNKDEEWVWIDMLAHIRAIYIPVAQTASKEYPDLSTWVQVKFSRDQKVDIVRDTGKFEKQSMTKLKGLAIAREQTIGLHIAGLVELLTVPRHYRKEGMTPFTAKLVKIVPASSVKSIKKLSGSYGHEGDLDWLEIQKAHSGLDLMWKKAEKGTWVGDFTKNFMTFGIGFIPGIGPLLAITFSLAWTAVQDGDESFFKELSLWCPAVKITEAFKADIKKSVAVTRTYVDPKHLKEKKTTHPGSIGKDPKPDPAMTMAEAKKIIDASGRAATANDTKKIFTEENKTIKTVSPFE
ncbi:uncharacterized protein PG998_003073 [Apiospora kogelbergensis]|uniref:uncharacterized protein n=1 Tax=Apiospora kogelbergensis TaxID=1337665 RepID=UPI00312FB778